MLTGKTVLVGITGGIAAYKICELVRMYKRANANVRVICTPNALNFVTKLTLQNLSQNEIGIKEFEIDDFKPEHISYADEADILVIAPATANTISKIANGICDNLLTSVICAFKKPVIIAPAMNCNMWENPVIQENCKKLQMLGYEILPTENGFLACGYEGNGRLCNLDKIFDETVKKLKVCSEKKNSLNDKKIVITAGGTIEDIDPVRYISNYSSGKMGFALADTAHKQGAEVVLITTTLTPRPKWEREEFLNEQGEFRNSGEGFKFIKVIKVKSALEMQNAIEKEFENADCVIMAAAVADYRVKNQSEQKIKKTSDENLTLELVKNPDILKELCEKKTSQNTPLPMGEGRISSQGTRDRNSGEGLKPLIVGFCAESENLYENAAEKFERKGCDYLIANDISRKDIGFESDFNEVVIFSKNSSPKTIEKSSKTEIAEQIFKEIYG